MMSENVEEPFPLGFLGVDLGFSNIAIGEAQPPAGAPAEAGRLQRVLGGIAYSEEKHLLLLETFK
jgi:hypothetical protein